ncbi:MAG: RNA ligase RtcB family protein [Anaeromicrobium sp.]|jgi:release factor H-coupled RctB family protein|uniref:RNA ligase RtcB family protein n=1 Tax=Anaeromicrobium sp. TaxID=1929132 RepID=UPI0025FAAD5B|nr:RNA ligase RtcB family protein [Anaeromicrobium sp.]MCT4595781.1 RNA ligase RtcB family protein [Anaeromicrobium sp.]
MNNIKIVQSNKSWIESNAIESLKKMANLKGIIKAVGLPDLHLGKTPVGASYLTKDIIYPHIIGNDIGCGMSLFSTGIRKRKIKVHRLLKKLEKTEEVHIEEFKNIDLPFREKLGTIGSGNHFGELTEIDRVYDENLLKENNIDKNNVFLLIHSGSRSYGEHILRDFIDKHSCERGIEVNSPLFKEYMDEHNRAMEFATINREVIAYKMNKALGSKENRKLLDSVHNSITPKKIYGQMYYIHRKGAAPSDVGLVVVAGSRGSSSYIVRPRLNLVDYNYSISHGAGRKWSRSGCKERLKNIYSKKDLRENRISSNLIYKDVNSIYEEAPEAYKNIERVIKDMVDANMIDIVATLKPLITYKV